MKLRHGTSILLIAGALIMAVNLESADKLLPAGDKAKESGKESSTPEKPSSENDKPADPRKKKAEKVQAENKKEKENNKEEKTSSDNETPTNRKDVTLLMERRVPFPFTSKEGVPLTHIIEYIRGVIAFNIITQDIDPDKIMIKWSSINSVKIKDALNMMLKPDYDYLMDENGVVIITTREKVFESRLETRSYDVLDLIIAFPNFEVPDIGLVPSKPAAINPPTPRIDAESLVDLVRDNLGKAYGGFDPEKAPGTSVEFRLPFLIVRHLPEVHKEVEGLLNQLR